MTLVIDNYDSFTWNLAQALMSLGEEVRVVRNDAITADEAEALDFDRLVLSPGPGRPEGAGRSIELVRRFAGKKPILGVCLGHQAIAAAFGAKIARAKRMLHGKVDDITHDGKTLFCDLPNPLRVMRYHSLVVDPSTLPAGFEVSATSPDGDIMGIRNAQMRMEGVQFHPESIGTESGSRMLSNFLTEAKERPAVKAVLKRLASREQLGAEEAQGFMDRIAEGSASPAQVGAFLAAITFRGPSVEELVGFAASLRERAVSLPLASTEGVIDTCGTGGDSSGTFNISTTAAMVAAGAGVKVAKHGNRSVTSGSGSADLLEALGVPIHLSPAAAAAAIEGAGMAFLFAPDYHPAFKSIAGPRRELGFRTLFNMMGPLINPARVKAQVVGVYAPELTETVAAVLDRLGHTRALVVHGLDGLDEMSVAAPTRITELRNGWLRTYVLDAQELGLSRCGPADLRGGDATRNAQIAERILAGEEGPMRDATVLNAAAAIFVADLAPDLRAGIEAAAASIDSGAASRVLARLRALGGEA